MTGYVFQVARCIQNSLSFVRAAIRVTSIESILQIDYSTPEVLGVGIQMVLVPTAVLATVIEFAIQVVLKIVAQAIQSPNGIPQITVVIATVATVLAIILVIAISITTIVIVAIPVSPVIRITIATPGIVGTLRGCDDRQT